MNPAVFRQSDSKAIKLCFYLLASERGATTIYESGFPFVLLPINQGPIDGHRHVSWRKLIWQEQDGDEIKQKKKGVRSQWWKSWPMLKSGHLTYCLGIAFQLCKLKIPNESYKHTSAVETRSDLRPKKKKNKTRSDQRITC